MKACYSKFSRKFAPEVSTAFNRGGFNLNNIVEKPADTWRGKKLWALKVDLSLVVDISECIYFLGRYSLLLILVYLMVFKIYLVHMTQKCLLSIENHPFVKAELTTFCCVIWQKKFQRDSVFVDFSTVCLVKLLLSRNFPQRKRERKFPHRTVWWFNYFSPSKFRELTFWFD